MKAINKDFQIVIPTHGRPTKQLSLRCLPQSLRDSAMVLTSTEADAIAIREYHKHTFSLESQGALKSHGQRIHTKRQWIMENVKADKLIQLDDDMRYFRRCASKYRVYEKGGRWKLTEEAKAADRKLLHTIRKDSDTEKLFDTVNKYLETYVHGCVSSRLGNDLEEFEIDVRGSRQMHAIAYNRKKFLELGPRFDAIPFREDFHVTLALFRLGYPNFKVNAFSVSPENYQSAGGCSTYRTVSASDRAVFELALLHPGFVTAVKKDYKNEARIEAQIAWRKAIDMGPSLGELVIPKKSTVPTRKGNYVVLPYASDREFHAYFDGKLWSVPSFSPKESPLCMIERMPFRVKTNKTLF